MVNLKIFFSRLTLPTFDIHLTCGLDQITENTTPLDRASRGSRISHIILSIYNTM